MIFFPDFSYKSLFFFLSWGFSKGNFRLSPAPKEYSAQNTLTLKMKNRWIRAWAVEGIRHTKKSILLKYRPTHKFEGGAEV